MKIAGWHLRLCKYRSSILQKRCVPFRGFLLSEFSFAYRSVCTGYEKHYFPFRMFLLAKFQPEGAAPGLDMSGFKNLGYWNTFLTGDFFCQSSHLHTEAYRLDMKSIAFRSGCFSWQNFNRRERRQNWICQALKNYDNRNTFLTGRIFCQSSRLHTAAYVLDMKSIAFRSGCFSWQNFSRREQCQNWICQALKNYDNWNTFLTGDFFCQSSHLHTEAYVLDMKSIAFRSGCFSCKNFNRREQCLDWICQALKI